MGSGCTAFCNRTALRAKWSIRFDHDAAPAQADQDCRATIWVESGYSAEIGRGLLEYGFNILGLRRLLAISFCC